MARALGRIEPGDNETELEITSEIVFEASAISLAQLATATGDAEEDCMAFVDALYPDDADAAVFHETITDSLYDRLEPLVDQVRNGVREVFGEEPLSSTVANAAEVQTAIATASIRISGAPAGSWAGGRPPPRSHFASQDGLFTSALKQSRAVFRDRLEMTANGEDPCKGPPLCRATVLNAYCVPSLKCTVLFLGLARRPWLDSELDDASLASAGLFIIAHELAHLSLRSSYTREFDTLLHRYHRETRNEAIADVGASLGILRTGLVSAENLALHQSQLWCARTPSWWQPSRGSHPGANERSDLLFETIGSWLS